MDGIRHENHLWAKLLPTTKYSIHQGKAMKTTGSPPGLLQDDCRRLFKWFASRIDARWTIRQVFNKEQS